MLNGKPHLLKKVNSSIIEQLIFESGPLSKPDLAKHTGLSLPTINKLVDALEKNYRLCPVGRTVNGVGRKAILYETNRNSGCILACYYQHGSYLCRLTDMLNNTIYEAVYHLDSGSLKQALDSTVRTIDALMEKAPTKVKVIGIGLPGVVQPDGCIMGIPQIPVWEGFNLKKELKARYKTEVIIENGVNLSAIGYYYANLQEKQDNLVYIYVGNGFGSGIILNKQLYRGSGNFSGEIGLMTEPQGITKRNYTVDGGYMESLMGKLVDYSTGEFRDKNDISQRKELIAILCTIAVNHVAILNPGAIVLSGKVFDEAMVKAMIQYMECYLPAEIMPLIIRDTNNTSGLEGLILNCRGYITTGVYLVQSTGLPQRAPARAAV